MTSGTIIENLLEYGMSQNNSQILIVYGTAWCGDCRRACAFLDEKKIPYKWVDINSDSDAAIIVQGINHGNRSVPTLFFPDGSILVEPSTRDLIAKFQQEI